MAGRNFSLTAHLSAFVDREVASGRHGNASEVVREALRRYEDDVEAERESLRAIAALVTEGEAAIARGEYRLIRDTDSAEALIREFADGPRSESTSRRTAR